MAKREKAKCSCGEVFAVQGPIKIMGVTIGAARGYWCWKCDSLRHR